MNYCSMFFIIDELLLDEEMLLLLLLFGIVFEDEEVRPDLYEKNYFNDY